MEEYPKGSQAQQYHNTKEKRMHVLTSIMILMEKGEIDKESKAERGRYIKHRH